MQPLTLEQLIEVTRSQIDDGTAQPRVSDSLLKIYLNEAVSEAAVRARLIRDDSDDAITLLEVAPMDVDAPDPADCTFDLSPAIFDIARVVDADTNDELFEITEEELFARGRWQEERGSKATHYYLKLLPNEAFRLRLFPMPLHEDGQNVRLDVYRTPLDDMEAPGDRPEISAEHHMALVHWAKFRTFITRDPDIESNADAALALQQFEDFFGKRDTAQQRRLKRARHAGVVKARKC